MKILITGAKGFVGSRLVEYMRPHYELVCQVRRRNSASTPPWYFEKEVSGDADWSEHFENIDVVVHLAAAAHESYQSAEEFRRVNVEGTLKCAQQAFESGVRRFVFMSSAGVLGNRSTEPLNEASRVCPHSPYTVSKMEAEVALSKLATETGCEVVIIRPVLVYGAGAKGSADRLMKLVAMTRVLPFGLCSNRRSVVSVDNLVDFIVTSVIHPDAANEVFCVTDGVDISIKDLTNAIAAGMSKSLIQIPVPVRLIRWIASLIGKRELVEQLVGDLQIDSTKARARLDWNPPFTMRETLRKMSGNEV